MNWIILVTVGVLLILSGAGLLVYSVVDYEEGPARRLGHYVYEGEAKMRIALGAVLILGGAFVYREGNKRRPPN